MFSHYRKLSAELYDITKWIGQSINGDSAPDEITTFEAEVR